MNSFTTIAFKSKSFSLSPLYIICKQVEFKGISGQIEFKEGQRNTFKLDLIKLKQNFFVKCGEWSPLGLNITDYDSLFEGNQMNTTWAFSAFCYTFEQFLIKISSCLLCHSLVVVTILQVPYVMIHTHKNTTGNAR